MSHLISYSHRFGCFRLNYCVCCLKFSLLSIKSTSYSQQTLLNMKELSLEIRKIEGVVFCLRGMRRIYNLFGLIWILLA